VQDPGYIDEAKERHIEELESLVSEYKAHIHSLDTEVQELAKRPVLDQDPGLQGLREELADERHALQEAHRGTSRVVFSFDHHGKIDTFSYFVFSYSAGMLEEKEETRQKDREKIQELEQTL
jgi:hypothetical protein